MATLVETVHTLVQSETATPPTASRAQAAPERHHPNEQIIPAAAPDLNGNERPVYLMGRMVGPMRHDANLVALYGAIVDYLKTAEPSVAVALSQGPSPAYHWAVGVGDYVHQLQSTAMFSEGWNYYSNIQYDAPNGGWDRFPVGTTRFNDTAVEDAATEAMNETPELYDVLDNNCQHYAIRLVDKVIKNGREQRFLTANGYQALEIDEPTAVLAEKMQPVVTSAELTPATQTVEVAVTEDPIAMKQDLLKAVNIMVDNTPTLKVEELGEMVNKQ